MNPRTLRWSIPDQKHDGSNWTDTERETAQKVAEGCEAVGMAGIFNATAADEYLSRAGLLDLVAQWKYRGLTRADVHQCIGLRTGAKKVARPMFLAYVARALNWQAANQLADMAEDPFTTIREATSHTLARLDMFRTGTKSVGPHKAYPDRLTPSKDGEP